MTDTPSQDAQSREAEQTEVADAQESRAQRRDPAQAGEQDAPSEQPEHTAHVPEDLPAKLEAALLTVDRPLTAGKLGEALGNVPAKAVNEAIAQLNAVYEQTGRSFRIEQVADGWQVMTLPEYADVLSALHKSRSQSKLTPAALETLAIIAYKQPVLRAELEAIRGVACGEVLRSLMDRHMVKIVGRAEEIGRPMLYGTTKAFLEVFGLGSLKDLPKAEELRPPTGSKAGNNAGSKTESKTKDKPADSSDDSA